MKVTLLSEPQHGVPLTQFFAANPNIELVMNSADVVIDCQFFDLAEKYQNLQSFASKDTVLITNTLTAPATAVAHNVLGFKRVIGVPIVPSQLASQKLVEYSVPCQQEPEDGDAELIKKLFVKDAEHIGDSVAGVFARTLSMIINEGAFAVMEGVATPADIDMAMKLGTNYPKGPLAWCDEIGAYVIVAILEALQVEYGHERYKIAPLLRLNAEAGKKFFY
ncbi:MAG TPA: 3-hydroxyacyl-CoA dehydrogenase family protein [Candidatus Kapabacteria bacterium]|nr:3-hydroxyacyl-CoA dehydrogenase family protein [Candidatus Kapabacteria bacterium]